MKEKEFEQCTGCNKNITTEEYITNGGYCEKCMNKIEETREQEETKTNVTRANKMPEGTIYVILVIIIFTIALISGFVGGGSSSKKSKGRELDYITKPDGTREWYYTDSAIKIEK